MDESAMLVLFHRLVDGDRRQLVGAVQARAGGLADGLGASGHRLMEMRSARHPVVVASGVMRARPMIRMLGGGRLVEGPARQAPWQVTEVFTFDGVDRLHEGLSAIIDGGPGIGVAGGVTEALGARAFRVAGRDPLVGDVGMCFTLRRRADVERSDMQHMWLDEHAPLVLKGRWAIGFDGYVQAHAIELADEANVAQADVDAVGFLTYSSMARMAVRSSLPGALAANVRLVRDEPRFIHPPATTLLLGTWATTTPTTERTVS